MSAIPHLIFIEPKPRKATDPSLCDAWKAAVKKYLGDDGSGCISIYQGKLREIDAELLRCDCMVSPANSFGLMDGGYVSIC